VLLLLNLARPAAAGRGDTPLPTVVDGQPAQAPYTALSVIKSNNLEADVVCGGLEATAIDIGFQVFDETGALRNDVGAAGAACSGGTRLAQPCTVDNSTDTVNGWPGAFCPARCVSGSGAILAVAPGRTVIGTAGTAVLHEDATMVFNTAGSGVPNLRNGSGGWWRRRRTSSPRRCWPTTGDAAAPCNRAERRPP